MDTKQSYTPGLLVEFTSQYTGLPIWLDRANIKGFQGSVQALNGKSVTHAVVITEREMYAVTGDASQLARAQNEWIQLQQQAQAAQFSSSSQQRQPANSGQSSR